MTDWQALHGASGGKGRPPVNVVNSAHRQASKMVPLLTALHVFPDMLFGT